ncbi:MAG: DUF1801 domain-containing protein, partial [Cyclobacteriaceae bacterium]
MKSYKSVDDFLAGAKQWRQELIQLREILLSTGLTEEVKWGGPIYIHNGKNIAGIAGFKSYVGLWFHQGALLKDEKKKLINAQEGVTKALRQWRFTSQKEIDAKTIKAYVKESIKNLEAGKEIKPAPKKKLTIPKELRSALKKNPKSENAFKALSNFKQREYAEFIQEAAKLET